MLLGGHSIMGADHQKAAKNNQDAFIYQQYENGNIFMAVSDGVGSQPYSEFGSRYQLLHLRNHFDFYGGYQHGLQWEDFEDCLFSLKKEIKKFPDERMTHFQATLIAAYISDRYIYTFGCGDGYILADEEFDKLESVDETPQTYTNSDVYNVFGRYEKSEISHLILSTDGLRYWQNDKIYPMTGKPIVPFQQAVKEKQFVDYMQMMNAYSIKRPQILRDDCTLVWYYND